MDAAFLHALVSVRSVSRLCQIKLGSSGQGEFVASGDDKTLSIHASIQNHFNQERHLYSHINFKLNRAAALADWRRLSSA